MARARRSGRPGHSARARTVAPTPISADATISVAHAGDRCERLADALLALKLERSDARQVEHYAKGVGLPQRKLGEWIRVERCSPVEARRAPLKRSHLEGPISGDREVWLTPRTLALPSGRVMQLQRHYLDGNVLDARLAAHTGNPEPSLVIRELVIPEESGSRAALRPALVAQLDATTIEPVPGAGR